MNRLFTKSQRPPDLKTRVFQEYDDHRNFYVAKHNFLLIKIQKVASTSLWIAAGKLLGHDIKTREEQLSIQLPALPGHQLDEYPEVFKAGYVRNPWDRLLSCYLQKKVYNRHKFYKRNNLDPDLSFPEFVEAVCNIPEEKADKHFRSQYTFLTNLKGEFLADFIGRFEHLSEDFEQMRQLAKLPEVQLPHWNKTEHDTYTSYYTPELTQQVAQRYAIDLELFGYEFGQPLSANVRYRWREGIPAALKLKIAQYKGKKLLQAIERVSQYTSPYE